MIIMNLKINNIYNFKNFNMNFTYPRKIENSTIENEFLDGFCNFRYKKVVILMGSNATGKTCLGKVIKNVCKFLNDGNDNLISSMISNKEKEGLVSFDIVNNSNELKRINITSSNYQVNLEILVGKISKNDTYDKVIQKLCCVYKGKYTSEVSNIIGKIAYQFSYPEIEKSLISNDADEKIYLKTLKLILRTLDPTINDVDISKDLKDSYIIRKDNDEIVIKSGKILNREILSSGTIEGVDIALFLANMYSNNNYFYYCDEHFSYVHSEIEKRIFQVMLKNIKNNDQLIFTTHNEEMLDLNLPKHTFGILKRDKNNSPNVVFVSSLLKRNTDSVKCAIQNDVFNSLPDLTLLDELECIDEE